MLYSCTDTKTVDIKGLTEPSLHFHILC